MKDNISVGIVLYNPDIARLKTTIKQLQKNVKNIYLINNNSNNTLEIEKIENVKLINNRENLGIAKALNQILDLSIENNDEFILTLDQDSSLCAKDLKKMLEYKNYDCSIIVPNIKDLNKEKVKKYNYKYQYVTRAITSGSIMRLSDVKEIGYFDEKMFIDYVDFDYCKRLNLKNKKIIRINNVYLNHEIGNRKKRKFLFLNVYPTNHSPIRVYYYSRNIRYYLNKYHKDLSLKEKLIEKTYLYWKYISIILYEKDKIKKLKEFKRGKRDYKKMK